MLRQKAFSWERQRLRVYSIVVWPKANLSGLVCASRSTLDPVAQVTWL